MPIAPYTWQPTDYVSAGRLMSELRQTGGAYYQPNGVRFHARRPVYKASTNSNPTATVATYNPLFGNSADGAVMSILADSFGTDPLSYGSFNGSAILNGGGAAGSNGGLGIVWGSMQYASGPATYGQAGIGWGTTNEAFGTMQGTNGGVPVQPWALDLVDLNASGQTQGPSVQFWKQAAATMATCTSPDGSGGTIGRTNGFWASVYPANGTPLAGNTLPSITTSIANGNTLTPAILNNTIQQSMQLLNMPPAFRANYGVTGTASTNFLVPYTSANANAFYDTYSGWNPATSKWTAPLPGIYLVCVFGGTASSPTYLWNSISVNGATVQNGPILNGGGQPVASGTCRVLSLNAGDTVQHFIQSASAVASLAYAPSMVILWLGANVVNPLGTGGVGPEMIDTSYQFAAGTPSSQVAAMLNSHVFTDIAHLIYKPYAAAWQATTQTVTAGSFQTLNFDHYTFPLHGDSGSIYGTWGGTGGSTWTAPDNGWYLINVEASFVAASATGALVGLSFSTPGQNAQDYMNSTVAPVGNGGGSTMLGLYYMTAGDTVTPVIFPPSTSTYTTGTAGNFCSHMEIVWMSE